MCMKVALGRTGNHLNGSAADSARSNLESECAEASVRQCGRRGLYAPSLVVVLQTVLPLRYDQEPS